MEIASALAGAIPWAAVVALFGVLLKVRVSGDPALWKRIEALEAKLEEQDRKILAERRDCDRRIGELEGIIRSLQQHEQSMGNLADNAAAAPLHSVYHPDRTEKDSDVLRQLDRVPGTRRRRK